MAIKLVQGGNSSTEKKTSNLKLTVSDASAFNKLASQTETSHVNMDAYKESKQESADSFYLNALKNNYINALSALEETKSPLGGSAYAPGVTLKQESEVQKAKSIYEQALERAESQKMEKYISEAKNSKSVNPLEVEDQSTYFKYINNIDQPVLPQSVKQYKPETYMTQDERDIFNYIYVNDGEDTAKKYVASIQDDLNQRSMPDIQKAADSLNPAVVAANAGLIRSVGGLQQVLREEAMPTNPFTVAAGNVREGLADTGPKILGQSLGQIGYDLIENTANMAPGIALGAATGGAGVAAVTLGASAAGNAYKEKLDEGYTPQQARVYSTLIGALEGGLQYAIGGIGAFGGTGNKIAQAVSGVKNAAARFALQYGGAMASEGLEEAAQEALEPVVATIALGKEFQPAEIENIAYAALLGGVSGGLFKGVEIASDVAGTSAVGSQVKKSGGVQSVIEEGLSNPTDSTSYKGATALQDRLNQSGKLSNFAVGEQVKKNADYRLTLGSANQTAQHTVNQQIAEQAEVSAPQQNVEQTGSQPTNLIDSAVAAFRENGSISNSQAVAIMQDADSMNILRYNGVELTDGMTMSQRRAAIKSGVESIARNQAVAQATAQQTMADTDLKLPTVTEVTQETAPDVNLPKVDTKGLVRDEELQTANISRTDADALDAVGKALGVGVKFVDQIGGGASNAAYSNGTIYIARDATDPLRTAFTHETVHRIKEAAPEAYYAMEGFIKENINSDIMAAYRNVLESRGYTGTEADFTEETVADAFGYILTDSKVLDQFVAKADKTVLQKIADTIREVIRKIKNILSGNSDVKLDPDNAAVFRDLLSKYEEMESVFYKAVRSVQETETDVNDENSIRDVYKENGTKFSLRVKDKRTLDFLNNQDTVTTYKTMQVIDGKLYPPMAARVEGSYEDYSVIGEWEQSVEHPELATKDGKFKLDKGKGQGSLMAAYNPYMHSSNLVINDQFSGAYKRNNLVTVECEVPLSELDSGYHAENAKDSVGWHSWHTGVVAGAVRKQKGIERKVFLSRWIKPVRIVPDSEVASMYKELLSGTDISVPDNVVSPSLLQELKKAGVKIEESGRLQKVNSVDNAKFSLKSKGDTKEVAALSRQLAATKKKVEYWKGQTKLTKKVTTDSKSVLKAAKEIVKDADSDVDVNEIAADLQAMYDKMAGTDVIYDEIREDANRIADTIIENAVVTDRTLYDETKEMRSFIRSQVFYISETDKSNIADYSEWKKSNKGIKVKVGTTNVDTIYSQLAEIYPEYFDESKISNPADQLQQIAYVYQATQEVVEYNPFDPDLQGAKVWLSNELIDRFFDLPQTAPTFADIAAKKLQEANARLKEAERSRKGELKKAEDDALLAGMIAQGRKDAAAMRAFEDKYALRLQGTKQKYEKKLESTKQRYEAQMNLAKEYYQSQLDSVRKQRDKKIEDIKEKYASKDAARREARNARSLRDKITRHASKLSQKLLNPTDTQHVPEAMRNAVANLLNSINMESTFEYDANGKRIKKGEGDPTKKTQAFQQLRDQYEKIIKSGNEDGLVIDPNLLDMIANITQYSNTPISSMSSNQLQEIWDTIRAVEKSISEAGKILSESRYARVSELANTIKGDVMKLPEYMKLKLPMTNMDAKAFFNIDMLSPVYFFKRFGKGGDAIYEMLSDSHDKQILIYQDAAKMRQEAIKGVNIRKLEKEVNEFTLESGQKIKMTTAQVMELYNLSKREKSAKHIFEGGIKPTDITKKILTKSTYIPYNMEPQDVSKIISSLSESERAVADSLSKIVEKLADYGNETYMEVYGYKRFTEENYWPIKVDKEQVKSDPATADGVLTVPNFSITKSTDPNASNAVVIGSVFDTMSEHVVQMATLSAYLKTWHDVNRVHNFWFVNSEGKRQMSMKNIISHLMGDGGNKYWIKLLQDISVGTKSPSDTMLNVDGLTSAFKATAVGANIRVIIQQPTAILRAMAVMNPKYLITASGKKNGWKKALRYSPIAQWKDWGYFEMNTGRSVKDILFDSESTFEKGKQFSMAGAAAADKITWGHLWNAVEEEVSDKNKNLKKGSSEFYEAVNKRFRQVVSETQVVDSVLHRTQLMRSSNALHRMASSFMSEPSVSYNMATNAVWEARNAIREGDKKAAGKVLAISIFALSASNAVNAVAQSIIDGLRDDDKKKKYKDESGDDKYKEAKYIDKFVESFYENIISAANPLGYVPYLNSLVSIYKGFDVTRSDMELPTEIIQSFQNAMRSYQGTGKNTAGYASMDLLFDVSRLFGLPLSNLKRDVQSITMTAAIQSNDYAMQYILDKAMYEVGVESNNGRFIDILYYAYLAGDESYEWIYNDLIENGMEEKEIRTGMESRMKLDAGVKSATDLDKRYVAPYQEKSYNDIISNLQNVKGWYALDDDQQSLAKDDAYQVVIGSDSGLKIKEKIDSGEKYGVTGSEYLVFKRVAGEIKSTDEKTRQEQIIEYLDYTGMSEKQKYYLYRTQYGSDTNNPYTVSQNLIIPKEEDEEDDKKTIDYTLKLGG